MRYSKLMFSTSKFPQNSYSGTQSRQISTNSDPKLRFEDGLNTLYVLNEKPQAITRTFWLLIRLILNIT